MRYPVGQLSQAGQDEAHTVGSEALAEATRLICTDLSAGSARLLLGHCGAALGFIENAGVPLMDLEYTSDMQVLLDSLAAATHTLREALDARARHLAATRVTSGS